MLGIGKQGLHCLMVEAYIVLHLLFGVSIWGLVLGQAIHLTPTMVVGTIEVHHR